MISLGKKDPNKNPMISSVVWNYSFDAQASTLQDAGAEDWRRWNSSQCSSLGSFGWIYFGLKFFKLEKLAGPTSREWGNQPLHWYIGDENSLIPY